MAERLGAEVDLVDLCNSASVDLEQVEAKLKADSNRSYKTILVVQTDTASLACELFEMDSWGVDLMVAGSQKGLMTPPGLGFMFFYRRVGEARKKAGLVTPYWDVRPLIDPEVFYEYFSGTAPTYHLFGLREGVTMLLEEEGLEEAWDRHAKLSRAVWAAFDAWGMGSSIRLNINDPKDRFHSATAASMDAPHATELRRWTEKKAGVTLGIGLGMAERSDPAYNGFFHVAHMGYVNARTTLGMLAMIDAGLKVLNISHSEGAIEAASSVVSEAKQSNEDKSRRTWRSTAKVMGVAGASC